MPEAMHRPALDASKQQLQGTLPEDRAAESSAGMILHNTSCTLLFENPSYVADYCS
jgi:hypothetical protein